MTNLFTIHYSEEHIELKRLEEVNPDWNKTHYNVKTKMLRLAFSIGGIEVLNYKKYLDHLLSLSSELEYLSVEGTSEQYDKLNEDIYWALAALYEYYSEVSNAKRKTQREYARIFVKVIEHKEEFNSSDNKATKEVAEELGHLHSTVRNRYYEMKRKFKDVPLENIKTNYSL